MSVIKTILSRSSEGKGDNILEKGNMEEIIFFFHFQMNPESFTIKSSCLETQNISEMSLKFTSTLSLH